MLKCVPEEADLKAVLEVVFFASIEREEGLNVYPRVVVFTDPISDPLPGHWPWNHMFFFNDWLEFTVENIVKLAPAFDSASAAIAVGRREGGEFHIIGTSLYGRPSTILDNEQGSLGRPPALILSVTAPGSVTVAYGDAVVGRLCKGEFRYAKPGPMASFLLTDHIISVISNHNSFKKYPNEYPRLYFNCFERLYSTAASRGHGSTIIWAPSAIIDEASFSINRGTRIAPRYGDIDLYAGWIIERMKEKDTGAALADNKKLTTDFIDFLANLSLVDGALLIDDKFRPHRFSCHLAAPEWNGPLLEGTSKNIKPTVPFSTKGMGTRHNSAIRFVGHWPGTVAIVVSEDGPVRVITADAGSAMIWPDSLNTVSLDF